MFTIKSRHYLGAFLMAAAICGGTVAAQGATKSNKGSDELHETMMDGMKSMHTMKMSGDVDKDFAAMMSDHHKQAIAMAKVEIAKGANPDLKAMAQKMIDAQQKEIDELKRFQ